MSSKLSPITVYWSTSSFLQDEDSWSFLYREPESLLSVTRKLKIEKPKPRQMFACPSVTSHMSNVYVVTHPINNTVKIPENMLAQLNVRTLENYPDSLPVPLFESKLALFSSRESSLEGYANISYNMSWILFADEPLTAKFTAPYYPPTLPCSGAMLSTGKFDIGSWYRPYNLDYHVPINTTELVFKENDHLFYVEFETERPIIFKRFITSKRLNQIQNETINKYPTMFGVFRPLKKRYEDSKKAKIPQIVLSEIKANLIE